ncbi:hypothetical protein F511_32289 [Dorcoceras hygrometricum]|uniref:Dystroglycan-like n=1 Tax=Dorcoceras hygrometricum TaxID=472368 RepID=A0A2Z7BQZ1_9LAMI|nr:hypothetical protein F511_32289 [Dorcoceras hygrometricum]
MASSLFVNTVHVCFESVLAMDNAGMVAMFESLVSTRLKGFLGCPTVIHEAALLEFFQNGSIRDGLVVSTVNGVTVEISEQLFAETFELPVEGLTDLSEIPKDLVFDARSIVSLSGEPVSISGKNKEMTIEFRILCDILAKKISVKAGSFDAITEEKFLMMAAITCGVRINWNRVLFNILKDMVTPGSRQAKGYAIQISLLLENVPNLELGESRSFLPQRSSHKRQCIVHRYIVLNDKVGMEDVTAEPRVKKTPVKKVASKKKPAVAIAAEPIVKKKRTTKIKSVSSKDTLDILPVAQDGVPQQMIKPTAAAPTEQPSSAPKRKSRRGKEDDIRSFVSSIALDRTVLRDVQIFQSSISVAPSVQMMLDQSPFSSSTSDDSSMHFDDNDTADTSISLPPTSIDVMEYLAKLRASVEQVQCEQFRRRDDAHNLRDILLVHIRDLEKKISSRFDEQDRVHRALHKDMHDQKNLSLLDLKSTHQKLSAQIAAAAFDTVDVRKEVKEINAKGTYLDGQVAEIRKAVMSKRGKVEATAPNHLLTIKADPAGEVVAVAIEQMSREVVLGKVVADVEVREEVIGVDLQREDITAVVVDRSEDHLKIG